MWEDEINYYEKLFEKDSKYKKRIARGASARASRKKGFKGGMKTPTDFMTKKQIREMSGEVKVSNIYDKYKDVSNLPDSKTLRAMSKDPNKKEELKLMLTAAKSCNSTLAIRKATGMSSGTLYKIYDLVGIEYNKGAITNLTKNKIKTKPVQQAVSEEIKPKNSFTIHMDGIYSKQDIEDRILSLTSLMLDTSNYKFELTLKEL